MVYAAFPDTPLTRWSYVGHTTIVRPSYDSRTTLQRPCNGFETLTGPSCALAGWPGRGWLASASGTLPRRPCPFQGRSQDRRDRWCPGQQAIQVRHGAAQLGPKAAGFAPCKSGGLVTARQRPGCSRSGAGAHRLCIVSGSEADRAEGPHAPLHRWCGSKGAGGGMWLQLDARSVQLFIRHPSGLRPGSVPPLSHGKPKGLPH